MINFFFLQVFSLRHPYVSMESFEPFDHRYQIPLALGQIVKVLDSKRDDWWLVDTFDEGMCIQGWVPCHILQHADCK